MALELHSHDNNPHGVKPENLFQIIILWGAMLFLGSVCFGVPDE